MSGGVAGLARKWTAAFLWCLLSLEADAVALESAELARGFTTLLLRLTEPVNVTTFSGCESVLSGASLQRMGTSPQCQWLLGGMALQVLLGHQPVLEPGDVVELLPSVGPALQTTVNSSELPQAMAALQLLPPQVQRCGLVDVVVDASLSSGGAGRLLAAEWRTGGSSQLQAGQVIQEFLALQNGSLSFTLPAATISGAVDAALAADTSLMLVRIELVLSTSNWLGLTNETSAVLEVDLSDAHLPVLEPSLSQSIRTNQSVSFRAATRYAELTTCAGVCRLQGNLLLGRCEHELGASLQNFLVTPWLLRFAAFSFPPGSSHQLRASAAFNATQVRRHVFQLDVAAAAPVVPVVTGPAVLPETCELVLDASQSFDPDRANEPQYFWSCAANDTAFNCHALSNFRTVTWTNTDGSGASGSALRISAGQLVEDVYTFNVTVIRATDRTSFGIASWMVEVQKASAVPITLSVPWYANQRLSGQLLGQLPEFAATVQVSDACGMSANVKWVWALVSHVSPSKILMYLDTTAVNLTDGEISVRAGALPDSYLVPGDTYAVALLESSSGTALADLAEAEVQGLRFARSVPFVADGAPSGGYIVCQPTVGAAIGTEFMLATSGWFDEDLARLVYAFYRFPLAAELSLVADAGGFSVSGTFNRPSVDWRNKSSPNYWSKLGGVFLGTSDASSLRLFLPPGEHMLAAVVEDELGAVSSAWLVGPLVQEPSSAASLATAALEFALRLGDAQIILNTLASTTFTMSADREREARSCRFKMSAACSRSFSHVLPDFQVVELLKTAGPSVAGTVSHFLMALLGSIASPTTGLDYLLEAALLMKTAFEEEASLRADQLRALLSKFGDAMVTGVAGSGEKHVKSLDHLADQMGLEVAVKDISLHDAVRHGVSVAGFSTLPLSEIEGQAGCGMVTGQITTWRRSNPYAWPNVSKDAPGRYVSNVTDVHVIEMRRCGAVLNISGAHALIGCCF
ncbi:galc [Symbiodinium natans]|uniref:Galc protein n=1 Tax=Symbiodinium natans TaxID=878477 RepID=A0A812I849_9DINO|nr:galc [Symbiodinium natans]